MKTGNRQSSSVRRFFRRAVRSGRSRPTNGKKSFNHPSFSVTMKKRSIASRLSRCCGRGPGKKWKLLSRRRLRRTHQFRKERKRLSSTPSFQFSNQRLDRVVASRIRWRHQWPRTRCVLRAVRWDDKSCAEFWEEFSEAVVAADSYCSRCATFADRPHGGGYTKESPGACEHPAI